MCWELEAYVHFQWTFLHTFICKDPFCPYTFTGNLNNVVCLIAAFVCLLLPPIDAPTVNLQVLYINPTGANPTGTLLSVERRKEIYQLCCDYNLLLLEDDPYYYLQFGDKDTRPPSFLSLDTQGRVLRSPLFIF